jgi:formiminotetrahydrofolate cyclodeaminase
LACVEACVEVVAYAEHSQGAAIGTRRRDLEVAALLTRAAATGAAANVLVNLPAMGDDSLAGELTVRTKSALDDVERTAGVTRQLVRHGEAREPLDGPVLGRR